jgi:hypothetical protein
LNAAIDGYSARKGTAMKRIAIIEEGYIRDAQLFYGDNDRLGDDDYDHEEEYGDFSPVHFIGVFEGKDEEEIRAKAAKQEGVHPGIVTFALVEL